MAASFAAKADQSSFSAIGAHSASTSSISIVQGAARCEVRVIEAGVRRRREGVERCPDRREGRRRVGVPRGTRQRPLGARRSAMPIEEGLLERSPRAVPRLLQKGPQRPRQAAVLLPSGRGEAEPAQHGRRERRMQGRLESAEGGFQVSLRRERQQAFGEARQVPQERVRLTSEGVKAGLVEIGGREGGIEHRQEAPGPVIEALAGDVDVVGVEHPVHEAGGHPIGAHPGDPAADLLEEGDGPRRRVVAPDPRHVSLHRIIEEAQEIVGLAEIEEALEAADADMRVAEPHEHGRARRRRLVAAGQLLAGLDQAERFRRVDAERLQHLRRQHLAHAALQRQAPVGAARPRRLAAAFGGEIEQTAVDAVVELGEEEAAAVAELRVVDPELVPVIAQGERLRMAARQRREAAEMIDPFGVGQPREADLFRPAPVAVAQHVRGKRRRRDDVVEGLAELGMAARGPVKR